MAIVPSVASGGRSQIPCDLKLALKQQGAEVEEAPSFGAATGQVVVVAGLARGSGELDERVAIAALCRS
jgi:hypothetical protein